MSLVRYKLTKKLFALALSVVLMFCSATTFYAADTSELKSKREKIEQQISQAQSKIESLKKEKKQTEEYISALDQKIQLLQDKIDDLQADADALQKNINDIQAKITDTENQIEAIQKEIDEKQAEFDKTFEEYCQRLRAMYMSGNVSNLEVLLSSTDISSILTRSQMIKSVSEQDSKTLDGLMKTMEEIEKDKASLEAKRLDLNKSKEKLQAQKKELTNSISKINASKSELDKEVSEANALMKKLNKQTSEYQESIETDKSKINAINRQIEAAYAQASHTGSMSGSTGNGAHSGTLSYPTSYRGQSAGYPNYNSGRYHGGVDFPCPSGTPVHAAAAGTVILAKNLNYSYGHYIIIDHGNGLSTLYAHNTTLLVGVGEHVSKGQTIAKSGSTGNSTGPHCHFEVRINGTRVNPNNYL